MSEETTKPEASTSEADPVKNIKAEMDRKLGNISETVGNQSAQLEALMSKLNEMGKPAEPAKPAADLGDLRYEDPEAYERQLRESIKEDMRREYQADQDSQAQRTQVISKLVTDFPELNHADSDLRKEVEREYAKLPKADQNNIHMWESLVYRKALEKGVKPFASRSDDEREAFTFGGSGMAGAAGSRRRAKEPKLAPETIEFAKIMGLNVEDEKVLKSLEKTAQRRWNISHEIEKD